MNKSVRDVLRSKGDQVFSIEGDATVFSALEMMAKENVGALLVMNGGKLVGILSERDYAARCFSRGSLLRRPKRGIS